MGIQIISEGMYDTAHSVYAAHIIKQIKPDAVFLELPEKPFQEIIDDYLADKFGEDALKRRLFEAMKKAERHIDNHLLEKFLAGEVEAWELEAIRKEGREVHLMKAAKKTRAKIFAMDLPLEEFEKELILEAEREHIQNVKSVMATKKLPNLIWELNEIIHYPFYVVERIMRHHAIITTNPYRHNVNECLLCMGGSAYDRAASSILFGILNCLPLSGQTKMEIKTAHLLRKMDYLKEKYMASVILEKYRELKKNLGREPKILVIVHLWNAPRLKWILKDVI